MQDFCLLTDLNGKSVLDIDRYSFLKKKQYRISTRYVFNNKAVMSGLSSKENNKNRTIKMLFLIIGVLSACSSLSLPSVLIDLNL